MRERPVRKQDAEPSVTFVVAAHNEERVIEQRLENLLALDYPENRLELVVVSDASTDRTDELVRAYAAEHPRIRLLRMARGGKVAAQDYAVRKTGGEILAFSDGNTLWRKTRSASSSAASPTRTSHTSADRTSTRRARGRIVRGHSAPRGLAAANRVAARVGHRRRRADLRDAPGRLRRARPPLRARPGAAVPARPARPPRDRRARGRWPGERPAATSRTSTAARSGCSSTAG